MGQSRTAPPENVAPRMADYRAQKHTHFQIKAKTDNIDLAIARIRAAGAAIRPGETLVVDANKAWMPHQALRILYATEGVEYYIEQPCLTYEDCLSIRPRVRQPMILDESMTDISVLLRALSDNLVEGVACKITRVGGISAIRTIRDICKAAGKFMTIDDMWGAELSVAAQAHLAVSTPADVHAASYLSTDFCETHYDPDGLRSRDGFFAPSDLPGLGVTPDLAILGDPIATYA